MQRRQNQFTNRDSARCAEIFRRDGSRPRAQKRKHAVKKTFLPRGVQPPVKINRGETTRRKGKLPLAIRLATVECTAPLGPKGLRGGNAHARAAWFEFRASSDLADWLIQERHPKVRILRGSA